MGKLDGKVAIVTGGGIGIGKAYSIRLAQEGAKVVIADIAAEAAQKTAEQVNTSGGVAIAVAVDVSDEKSTLEMAKKAYDKFGRIDILVNNAALFTAIESKPWDQITVGEWDHVMAVNTRGPWLCTKAVFPYMKAQGKGKIINISSAGIFGAHGSPARNVHYLTSKGAVVAFTRIMARALGDYNINVNTIAPGGTESEKFKEKRPPEVWANTYKLRCLQRAQTPESVAGTVVFLASDDSDQIDGQMIVVDGGRVLY